MTPEHDSPYRGSLDAAVKIVEFGDFECPFCRQAYGEVEQLLAAAGDEVLFTFRHFPLVQLHPHAMSAAEAAEAAGAQGRFWEMHELLFQNQDDLEDDSLVSYARAIDLDLEKFVEDLRTHRHQPKIRRDFLTGVRSGVNGTPTFFVNGRRLETGFSARVVLAALRGEAAYEGLT